jgi:hypothetical protein
MWQKSELFFRRIILKQTFSSFDIFVNIVGVFLSPTFFEEVGVKVEETCSSTLE